MYYEDAIKLLTNYYNILRDKFSPSWSDCQIRAYSYRESAIADMINRILDNPFEDAIDVINSYNLDIEFMRKLVGTPKSRLIFSQYSQVIDEVILLIKEIQTK